MKFQTARKLTTGVTALFVCTFVGGMLAFPNAPIIRKGSEFLGKYGPSTEAEFIAYFYWKIVVISLFVSTFMLQIWLMTKTQPKDPG